MRTIICVPYGSIGHSFKAVSCTHTCLEIVNMDQKCCFHGVGQSLNLPTVPQVPQSETKFGAGLVGWSDTVDASAAVNFWDMGIARNTPITTLNLSVEAPATSQRVLFTRSQKVKKAPLFRKELVETRSGQHFKMARKNPNIIITGTPGVGKTTHAEQLARSLGLQHVSVNQIVKDEGFHEGKDEELGSWVVDEDKVIQHHLYEFQAKLT